MAKPLPYPMPAALREFVHLFNHQEFYDAHEVLEDLWVIEVGPEKDFLKGLIMAAAALCHWQKGNGQAALRVAQRAGELLAPLPDGYLGIPVRALEGALRRVLEPLEADPSAPCPPADSWPRFTLNEDIFLAHPSH